MVLKKLKTVIANVLIAFCIIFIFYIIIGENWQSRNLEYSIISSLDEFNYMYEQGNPENIFIDLRDEEDYEAGHLNQFINVPYNDQSQLVQFLNKNKYKKKRIILMCYSSKRAGNAFNELIAEGFRRISVLNFSAEDILSSGNIETGPCNCLD